MAARRERLRELIGPEEGGTARYAARARGAVPLHAMPVRCAPWHDGSGRSHLGERPDTDDEQRPGRAARRPRGLAALLLVAVLAEPLLPLVRGDLVALALLAAGHRSRGIGERSSEEDVQDSGLAPHSPGPTPVRAEASHPGTTRPAPSASPGPDSGRHLSTNPDTRASSGTALCETPPARQLPRRAPGASVEALLTLVARLLLPSARTRAVSASVHKERPRAQRATPLRALRADTFG